MYWCTKGSEHALSRQEQEINKSIFHHTRFFSLYHKAQHKSFWIFLKGWLYMKANMLCDEKAYQARNHVSTVVGAFLAFVFIFLLLCLAYTTLLIHFSSADSLALEDQKQNDFLQCYVFSYISLVTFPESLHVTSSAWIGISSGQLCSDTFHLSSFELSKISYIDSISKRFFFIFFILCIKEKNFRKTLRALRNSRMKCKKNRVFFFIFRVCIMALLIRYLES